MTGSTQVSMQETPLSAQVPDTEPAKPHRLTWLHIDAAKQTAPRQPARGPLHRTSNYCWPWYGKAGRNRSHIVAELIPKDTDICGGLETSARGARVMLRKSVSTDDGLVNGAWGTITGCRWSSGNSSTAQPDGIEIKFDNEDVGKQS